MKKRVLIPLAVCMMIVAATIFTASNAGAASTNPLGDLGDWVKLSDTNLEAGSSTGGTITNLEFFDNALWAFGSHEYNEGTVYKLTGETWEEESIDGYDPTDHVMIRSSAVLGDTMVFGTHAVEGNKAELWRYDPESNEWSKMTGLPDYQAILDISGTDDFFCVSALMQDYTNYQVACYDGDSWTTHSVDAGVSFENGKPTIQVIGTDVYIMVTYSAGPTTYSSVFKANGSIWTLYNNSTLSDGRIWQGMSAAGDNLALISFKSSTGDSQLNMLNTDTGVLQPFDPTNFGLGEDSGTDFINRIITLDGAVVVLASVNGVGRVFALVDAEAGWLSLNDDGDFLFPDDQPSGIVNDVISVGPAIIAATAHIGMGDRDASVWALFPGETEESTTSSSTTVPTSSDADDDGISDSVEDSAPHSGDANNDGTPDGEQSNVSSFVNGVTGKYSTIVVPESCSLTSTSSRAESTDHKDIDYSYPVGLLGFSAACGDPGITITVEEYVYGAGSASSYVPRKFLSYNNSYVNLTGAALSDVTIGGESAAKLVFSLTDGGQLDNDQEANGTIVDPAGLSTQGDLPTTGSNTDDIISVALAIFLVGIAIAFVARRRRKTLTI